MGRWRDTPVRLLHRSRGGPQAGDEGARGARKSKLVRSVLRAEATVADMGRGMGDNLHVTGERVERDQSSVHELGELWVDGAGRSSSSMDSGLRWRGDAGGDI